MITVADNSFMQYMRAHGNTPSPTQRPFLAGAIGGALTTIPALLVLWVSGALTALATNSGVTSWTASAICFAVAVIAGVLYAAVFRRAANDPQGGWLFGISYGFLIWMLSPLTLWQIIADRPMMLGRSAIGVFAAHVFFGFVLGVAFRWIDLLVQTPLADATDEKGSPERQAPGKLI